MGCTVMPVMTKCKPPVIKKIPRQTVWILQLCQQHHVRQCWKSLLPRCQIRVSQTQHRFRVKKIFSKGWHGWVFTALAKCWKDLPGWYAPPTNTSQIHRHGEAFEKIPAAWRLLDKKFDGYITIAGLWNQRHGLLPMLIYGAWITVSQQKEFARWWKKAGTI